jgi:DNA/RNA endonuclease YhcR with UshA esterase domain
LTGCASGVRIAEIKTDPGRFGDRTVEVTGTVTSSYGVPLVPFQLYNIDDGTGEIAVLSRTSRSAPAKGARVQVKGRVGEVASFGSRSVGLHIEEQSRKSEH